MGMVTEAQILKSSQDTNAILIDLVNEVRRTNALLEWLGEIMGAPRGSAAGPASTPTT